jgi:hypothetical protein
MHEKVGPGTDIQRPLDLLHPLKYLQVAQSRLLCNPIHPMHLNFRLPIRHFLDLLGKGAGMYDGLPQKLNLPMIFIHDLHPNTSVPASAG